MNMTLCRFCDVTMTNYYYYYVPNDVMSNLRRRRILNKNFGRIQMKFVAEACYQILLRDETLIACKLRLKNS